MITLTLQSNTTTEQAVANYLETLKAYPKEQNFGIRTVDNKPLTPTLLVKLIDTILSTAKVANLNLSNLGITKPVLSALEAVLSKEDTLAALDLSHNYIGDEGTKILTKILQKNKAITKCDISDNEITDIGAGHLAAFFKNNTSLKTLKITHNKISNEQGFLNNSLVFLDADYNELTKLDTKPTLSTKALWFNFDNNKITNVSAECLYAFDREKATLDLSHNPLDDKTQELLGNYEYAKFADSE